MTDLEEIKQKVDIVTLLSEYVVLKKMGTNFKGLCPFHSEKTPSFVVSPERQIWHCFGGCQEGGDIFKFLQKMENIEFPEALRILAKRAGVTLTSYQPTQNQELRDRIYSINHLAAEFYNYILSSHPLGKTAREYLLERKITSDSIKLFGLGYAPNSWDSLLKFLTKKGYTTSDLDAAGLVSKSGIGHFFDRFRGRLIFTLKDHRGNVVGFAGRLLDPAAKEAKYINTAETTVYVKGNVLYGLEVTREEIKKAGFAVVTEGEIDTIQSYQAGVKNVVAIKGSALTGGQVGLLKRYTENVYLSLDADFAGDAAAHRGIEMADSAGLNIKVVILGDPSTSSGFAKDPDELIKKNPGLWHKAVVNAVSFYDYIIDSALEKHDPTMAEDAKMIVVEVAKFIEPIENLVVKNHYLKKLAVKLNIDEDTLETQLGKEFKKLQLPHPQSTNQTKSQFPITNKSRIELLEEYLLSILLQARSPADYLVLISGRLEATDFITIHLGKIYQLMVSFVGNPKSDVEVVKFDIKTFAKLVPPELVETVDRLYLQDTKIDFTDDQTILAEIQTKVWEIKELSLREKLKKISEEIRKNTESAQLEQDFTKTAAALQKLTEEKGLISSAV